MNISELYQKFTKGETLHTLGVRESRALLDYCRSKLLGMGRTLKAAATGTTAEAKAALLEAHRELQRAGLADATQVYNSAAHQDPLGGRTVEECENLLAEFRAHNAAPKKREFRATPATEADLRRQFEIAKQNRPTPARVPSPAQAPARPAVAATPPATRPTATAREIAVALLDEQAKRDAAALVKTRAQLDTMKPAAITAFFKNGGTLVS
jgi:hypothetical protein